jgi:dipeptidyl aminopeptidase/acylaminoacyl peptidase
MVGWSRGGMMTYLALTRTDRIAAAVVTGGLTDLFDAARRRHEMETVYTGLILGYPEEGQGGLEARSAVRWAEKLCKTTPLLIKHGAADTQVDPSQALAMASRLLAIGHPFRLVLFEGDDHRLSQHADESQGLTRAWLDRYVRDRKPVPHAELTQH